MKPTQTYIERIKEAQEDTRKVLQEVKKGVITQEQAADKIISLREKIDAIYDEMHGQFKLK